MLGLEIARYYNGPLPMPGSSIRPILEGSSMKPRPSQHGSAMIEFAVVGPMITLLGLAVIQYAMLFFAKNQINHASFIAARSGSLAQTLATSQPMTPPEYIQNYVDEFIGAAGHGDWESLRCTDDMPENAIKGLQLKQLELPK